MKKIELIEKIIELESENKQLHLAYELLLKSLPIIHMKAKLEDSSDERKNSLIELAVKGSATLIKTVFDLCKLKTHINTTIIFQSTSGKDADNETFELTFIKKP